MQGLLLLLAVGGIALTRPHLLVQPEEHALVLIVLQLINQILFFLGLALGALGLDRWLFGVLLLLLRDELVEIVILGRIRSTV